LKEQKARQTWMLTVGAVLKLIAGNAKKTARLNSGKLKVIEWRISLLGCLILKSR
jgi:hypothetical protein